MRKPLIFALTALALAAVPGAAVPSPYPVSELFPVEPGLNAERGFAVAVDGDWLAMGAPRDDDDKDAGAVYLFQWSGTTWDQKKKLFADTPLPGAQLGFALAMRNGILAAGVPGEGVVYIFAENDGVWSQAKKLRGTHHGVRTFGRSLALDGIRLAVGAVEVHGAIDGAVYLYKVASWACEQMVYPPARQRGERFGSAVSLAGNVLVVGAPGYDVGTGPPANDAGAVYVFQRPVPEPAQGPIRWREKAKLLPPIPPISPDSPPLAGQQFGSAVATDGTQIFVGAPTADPANTTNSGALYWFVRGAGGWDRRELPEVKDPRSRDQLGASLALSGKLLVAGAPAPPPGTGTGKAHLFRHTDASWHEVDLPVADNAEARDLAGLAVAVDSAKERVVVGGVLGDQGAGAAGAVWSFRCPVEDPDDCLPAQAYAEEAEAVARDPFSGKRYGASVALTHDFMAVGATESRAVYLYRRAGSGWRQEARLPSAYKGDGFGSSVALEGSLLAVGAPQARGSGVGGDPGVYYPNGSVDLFVHQGSSWVFETTLAPSAETTFVVAFGTSVAIAAGVVAVGARVGDDSGAVYLFQKGSEGWTETSVLTAPAEGFGAAVSLRGGVLAIGAPGANGGQGAAYVSVRGPNGWSQPPQLLPDPLPGQVVGEVEGRALGSAVAVGDGVIAVGAPEFLGRNEEGIPVYGAVFLYEMAGTAWETPPLSALAPRRFGSSVALLGNRLVVGAPGQGDTDPSSNDLDRAAVFERRDGVWVVVADLDALQPPHGDEFGFAVALSDDFFVVTSPELPRGDRVTVFALPPAKEGRP